MTNEDKKLICDYMDSIGWRTSSDGTVFYCAKIGRGIRFDLNDAALCVQEMQKRGDYRAFDVVCMFKWANDFREDKHKNEEYLAWLMTMEDGQAKNFFKAFVEWRKGK